MASSSTNLQLPKPTVASSRSGNRTTHGLPNRCRVAREGCISCWQEQPFPRRRDHVTRRWSLLTQRGRRPVQSYAVRTHGGPSNKIIWSTITSFAWIHRKVRACGWIGELTYWQGKCGRWISLSVRTEGQSKVGQHL